MKRIPENSYNEDDDIIIAPTKAPTGGIRHVNSRDDDEYKAAMALATNNANKFLLTYGPSGSGKSFFLIDLIVARAMRAPESRHAIFRLTLKSCEQTLFQKTLHEVLDKAWPGLKAQCEFNLSKLIVTFPNKSKIFFAGLDENRVTNVLGDEFNTILINECNEDGLSFSQVSTLLSRLRKKTETIDGKILKNKMFFDCNPRYYSDWEYKAFRLHINPDDGDALYKAEQWVSIKLNTRSNQANLHEDYIDGLNVGDAASRRRYLEGEWSDENQNALFTDKMFVETRIPRPAHVETPNDVKEYLANFSNDKIGNIRLERFTIAIDPAKSNDAKSDLNGITVQASGTVWNVKEGRDETHAFVLADHSDRMSPQSVCELAKDLCQAWGAQRIVYESNATGAWLPATMFPIWQAAPLKPIAATSTTGNKTDRAEPVAAQYERKAVHHVGTHKALEAQMCDWGSPASRRKSPDRMDAVVWGITELLDLAHEKKVKPGGRIGRRGNRL